MGIYTRRRYTLKLRSQTCNLGQRTLVMGILNVTPDSFSDGGRFDRIDLALAQAQKMIQAGVDIIDIGGESTRPFSEPVPAHEEEQRVIPVIKAIRAESDIPISIDTTKALVAQKAIEAGANIINDVSALRFDPDMGPLAAESGVPLVLMHMKGEPKTMQQSPHYDALLAEIITFLQERVDVAVESGVSREQIIVDPGIGFGKTVSHNLAILRDLHLLNILERPILLGASRKRFIGSVLNRPIDQREVGTAVACTFGILSGIHIIRVHDVAYHRQVARLADAIVEGHWPAS